MNFFVSCIRITKSNRDVNECFLIHCFRPQQEILRLCQFDSTPRDFSFPSLKMAIVIKFVWGKNDTNLY
jgi:hypothetical protein